MEIVCINISVKKQHMNKVRLAMSMGMLMLADTALGKYIETKLDLVTMSDSSARLYNGIKQSNEWILRNGNSGSILNLTNKNADHDEWSLEIKFKAPQLIHPEFAGLYFWYTEEPIKHGGFKGASGRFNGVMAGLEFIGKSVDIVVSVNHGENDYTNLKPEETELKDSPDPSIFKGHTDLILKIISTAKNFKIEVYDANRNMLYDRVRYTSMTEIGSRLSGKYFGLTTDYSSTKATENNGFHLQRLDLFEREETEEYDPDAYHTEVADTTPRLPHEIPHTNEEIQHTISGIEHLTKYLRVVLGDPQSRPVAENVVYIKKLINFQSAHTLEIRDEIKAMVKISKKHAMEEDAHRQELFYLVQNMSAKLAEMSRKEELEPRSRNIPIFGLIALGCSLFAGGFVLGKKFSPIKKISLH
ncbi:hypothetical protein NEIG_01969 [Nematocida sp. ERTm5]|nr:hypothetical protein NEIG_01969 [Nematocida sp. ERTm5]